MIVVPRSAVRAFRAVYRKAAACYPRGPAPPVLLRPVGDAVVLAAAFPGVIVSYRAAAVATAPVADRLAVPPSAFDGIGGPGDEPVTIAAVSARRAEVRWADGGLPRAAPVDIVPATGDPVPPDPMTARPVPAAFLAALHEAGRFASRQPPSQFALEKVQVRGAAGEVVGTDGRWAIVRGGFKLPFKDDMLVPAVPVFGCPELRAAEPVAVGRTAAHVVVRAGPWTVHLAADTTARFPAVRDVVPRTVAATLALAEEDADHLAAVLPRLPGQGDDDRPVTVDLAADRVPCVRARAEAGDEVVEVPLARSTATGTGRVAINREWLRRALALGCRTVCVAGPDKPAVATVGDLLALSAPLIGGVVEPAKLPASPFPHTTQTERTIAMKSTDSNGHVPARPAEHPPDPLAEAEALRSALTDAAQHAARLVALLKDRRRERKALSQAWASLKTLNPTP